MKRIETPRLVLRPLDNLDTQDVFTLLSDIPTTWWADILPMTDEDEALDFIRWGNDAWDMEQWGICEKGSDKVIGLLQVMFPFHTKCEGRFELGYMLHPEYRRRGLMAEAMEAVCRELFRETYVSEVMLEIHPDNAASRGVARRAGFTLLKEKPGLRPKRRLDGEPLDTFIISREALSAATAA